MDLMDAVVGRTHTPEDPSPCEPIPWLGWITNAVAGLIGSYAAVTHQSRQTGCSRQCVYDHAAKVLAAVEAQHDGGPTRQRLTEENAALRRENAQLWDWCRGCRLRTTRRRAPSGTR
jgi:hypothetical protein